MGARILQKLTTEPWELTGEALKKMIEIAERHSPTADELQARIGKRLEYTRKTTLREGVAVIPIEGPIFKKAEWFHEISGATSTASITLDFNEALENPDVRAILFNVDSPGGEATGLSELSEMIYRARGRKPIVAFVEGSGFSAAYHIISAADSIVAGPQGFVGSIGAIISMRKVDESKTFQFVASQSPNKVIDPATDAGAAALQEIVDDVADVFVRDVARNRGVSVEAVLSGYGAGGVLIASRALKAGMIERVAIFDDVLAELAATAPDSDRSTHGTSKLGSSPFEFRGSVSSAEVPPPIESEGTPMAEETKKPTLMEYLSGLSIFSSSDRKKIRSAVEALDTAEGVTSPPAAITQAAPAAESPELIEERRRRLEAERRVNTIAGETFAGMLVSQGKCSPAQGERIGFCMAELAALDAATPVEAGKPGRVEQFKEIFGMTKPADLSKPVVVGSDSAVLPNARTEQEAEAEELDKDKTALRAQFGASPAK